MLAFFDTRILQNAALRVKRRQRLTQPAGSPYRFTQTTENPSGSRKGRSKPWPPTPYDKSQEA